MNNISKKGKEEMSKTKKVDVFAGINFLAKEKAMQLCEEKSLVFTGNIIRASEYSKDINAYYVMAKNLENKKYTSWYMYIEPEREQLILKSKEYDSKTECYHEMLERVCIVVDNKEVDQEHIGRIYHLKITQEEAKTLNFFLWWARKRSDRELNACRELIDMFKEENSNLSLKLESDKEFLIEMNATVDEIIPKIAKIAYQNQEEEQ